MTKSIILAAAIALTLGTGAAMAQGAEGDAQNLFDGYHGLPNLTTHAPRTRVSTAVQSGSSDVRFAPNTLAPAGGSDGGGN